MEKEEITVIEETVTLPIKWHMPDSIITRFASNMVVQTIENEFKLSFFEVKPEIRFPKSERKSTEVIADCVASVIVTADRLPKFIKVLQKQLDIFNEKREKKENPSAT